MLQSHYTYDGFKKIFKNLYQGYWHEKIENFIAGLNVVSK